MARRHKKLSPRDAGDRSSSSLPSRKMKVTITVSRRPTTAGRYSEPYAFEACVRMRNAGDCGFGRNPRKAVANAMAAVAKRLRKRGGAFRGMR